MDEVFLTINGERHYRLRTVDQNGHILDSHSTSALDGTCFLPQSTAGR
jgi:hypothetical protein